MNKLNDTTQTYFFGRSYSENLRCFGLREADLMGLHLLDCAAGPSAFAADACPKGIRVTAVDPMYYRSPSALKSLGEMDYENMFKRMKEKPDLFSFRFFESFEAAKKDRYAALDRFLGDYSDCFPTGRYVAAKLPELPFEDGFFDIALCGHLFFVYAFDFEFHLKAIRELCRVSRGEVRIHPVVDSSGHPHAFLDSIMNELETFGYKSFLQSVDYTFFKGSDKTLVIRRDS